MDAGGSKTGWALRGTSGCTRDGEKWQMLKKKRKREENECWESVVGVEAAEKWIEEICARTCKTLWERKRTEHNKASLVAREGRRHGEHWHAADQLHLRRDRLDHGHLRHGAAPVEGVGLHREQHPDLGDQVGGHLDELHLPDHRPHAVQNLRLNAGAAAGHPGGSCPHVPGHLHGLAVMHRVLLRHEVHHLRRWRPPRKGRHRARWRDPLHPHGPVRTHPRVLDGQHGHPGFLQPQRAPDAQEGAGPGHLPGLGGRRHPNDQWRRAEQHLPPHGEEWKVSQGLRRPEFRQFAPRCRPAEANHAWQPPAKGVRVVMFD